MTPAPGSAGEALDRADRMAGLDDGAIDGLVVEMITRFPAEAISGAIAARMHLMEAPSAPLLLRLIEALARRDLFEALADSLTSLPDLPPPLLMEAMEVLEGTGCIEVRPALVDLRADVEALYDEHATIEELASQIEGEPGDMGLALEALFLMTPEERDEILDGLKRHADGPAVRELLRRASDRPTSTAEEAG